jgi:hypothetical protein
MKRLLLVCVAVAVLPVPATAGGSKLYGTWHLAKGSCAQRAFTFVDGAEIVDEAYPGFAPSHSTYKVSYNDANPQVTHVTGTGGETAFKFIGANRVLMDTSNFCEYVRS